MDYKNKYIKYKSKYLDLKNEIEGGSTHNNDFDEKFKDGEIINIEQLNSFVEDPCITLGFFDVCIACPYLYYLGLSKTTYEKFIDHGCIVVYNGKDKIKNDIIRDKINKIPISL